MVTIGFDPVPYFVEEDDGRVALVIRVLDGQLGRPITAIVSTEDGTATSSAPQDFINLGSASITFDGDVSVQQVFVSIVNDDIFENIEMFFANLVSFDPAVIVAPSRAEISISEDPENNDRELLFYT